jgi:hypothetical protein
MTGTERQRISEWDHLVVAVEDAPERMPPPSSKGNTGGKTGAKKRRKSTPEFKWVPSTGPSLSAEYSASALARKRTEERGRLAKEKEAQQARTAARVRRRTEELRAVWQGKGCLDPVQRRGLAETMVPAHTCQLSRLAAHLLARTLITARPEH